MAPSHDSLLISAVKPQKCPSLLSPASTSTRPPFIAALVSNTSKPLPERSSSKPRRLTKLHSTYLAPQPYRLLRRCSAWTDVGTSSLLSRTFIHLRGAAVPRLNSQNLPSNFWAQLAKPRRTRECAFDRPDDIREAPQNASSPRGAIRLPWTFCLGIDPSPVRREGCSPRTGTQADALVFNRTPFLNPVPFDR